MDKTSPNIITEKEIKYSTLSFVDPVGRVFFARNKVFRAINNDVADEIIGFLHSDCYNELYQRGWIVETKIANDVKLEAYPLILEHEKIHAVRWQLLSKQQLIESAKLHIEISQLCARYGYYLYDSGFNNIGVKQGKLCLLDFGSIRRGEERRGEIQRETYAFSFLYATLCLMDKGYYQLARSLEPIQYILDVSGSQILQNTKQYNINIVPLVNYYKIALKIKQKKYTLCRVRTKCGLRIIYALNQFVRTILGDNYRMSNLFKVQPVFKELESEFIKGFEHEEVFRVDDCIQTNFIKKLTDYIEDDGLQTAMVYGEYPFKQLSELSKKCNNVLYVVSPDIDYCNEAYKYFSDAAEDVIVLNYSPISNQYLDYLKDLNVHTFIAEPQYLKSQWRVNSLNDNALERIAYFSDEMYTTVEKQIKRIIF